MEICFLFWWLQLCTIGLHKRVFCCYVWSSHVTKRSRLLQQTLLGSIPKVNGKRRTFTKEGIGNSFCGSRQDVFSSGSPRDGETLHIIHTLKSGREICSAISVSEEHRASLLHWRTTARPMRFSRKQYWLIPYWFMQLYRRSMNSMESHICCAWLLKNTLQQTQQQLSMYAKRTIVKCAAIHSQTNTKKWSIK